MKPAHKIYQIGLATGIIAVLILLVNLSLNSPMKSGHASQTIISTSIPPLFIASGSPSKEGSEVPSQILPTEKSELDILGIARKWEECIADECKFHVLLSISDQLVRAGNTGNFPEEDISTVAGYFRDSLALVESDSLSRCLELFKQAFLVADQRQSRYLWDLALRVFPAYQLPTLGSVASKAYAPDLVYFELGKSAATQRLNLADMETMFDAILSQIPKEDVIHGMLEYDELLNSDQLNYLKDTTDNTYSITNIDELLSIREDNNE